MPAARVLKRQSGEVRLWKQRSRQEQLRAELQLAEERLEAQTARIQDYEAILNQARARQLALAEELALAYERLMSCV